MKIEQKKIKQTKNKTKFLISLNEKLAKLREMKKKIQSANNNCKNN